MARYEVVEGKSNKFWEIELEGKSFTTTYGRIGTAGQSTRKTWETNERAKQEHDKVVAEKTKKGYRLVGEASPTTEQAPKPVAKTKKTAAAETKNPAAAETKKTKTKAREKRVAAKPAPPRASRKAPPTGPDVLVFSLSEVPLLAYLERIVSVPAKLTNVACYIHRDTDEEIGLFDRIPEKSLDEAHQQPMWDLVAGLSRAHPGLRAALRAPEKTAYGFHADASVEEAVSSFEADGFRVHRVAKLLNPTAKEESALVRTWLAGSDRSRLERGELPFTARTDDVLVDHEGLFRKELLPHGVRPSRASAALHAWPSASFFLAAELDDLGGLLREMEALVPGAPGRTLLFRRMLEVGLVPVLEKIVKADAASAHLDEVWAALYDIAAKNVGGLDYYLDDGPDRGLPAFCKTFGPYGAWKLAWANRVSTTPEVASADAEHGATLVKASLGEGGELRLPPAESLRLDELDALKKWAGKQLKEADEGLAERVLEQLRELRKTAKSFARTETGLHLVHRRDPDYETPPSRERASELLDELLARDEAAYGDLLDCVLDANREYSDSEEEQAAYRLEKQALCVRLLGSSNPGTQYAALLRVQPRDVIERREIRARVLELLKSDNREIRSSAFNTLLEATAAERLGEQPPVAGSVLVRAIESGLVEPTSELVDELVGRMADGDRGSPAEFEIVARKKGIPFEKALFLAFRKPPAEPVPENEDAAFRLLKAAAESGTPPPYAVVWRAKSGKDKDAVELFERLLDSADPQMRYAALEGLARQVALPQRVLPRLRELLTDPSSEIRAVAFECLSEEVEWPDEDLRRAVEREQDLFARTHMVVWACMSLEERDFAVRDFGELESHLLEGQLEPVTDVIDEIVERAKDESLSGILSEMFKRCGPLLRGKTEATEVEEPEGERPPVGELLVRLERAMREHYPKHYAKLRPGAKNEELDAFELKHGLTMPPALRELYRWHDGSDETGFLYGHTWQSLRALETCLASFRKVEGDVNPEGAHSWFHPHWLPVFESDSDGFFVAAWAPPGKSAGHVISFSHETGGSDVWSGFEEFLEAFVGLVESSRWGTDEGEQAMLSEKAWRKAARKWGL